MDFTPQEQRLIAQYARSRGYRDWLWFYAAVLIAPITMAAYGVAQRDVLAMGIAFGGLLAMVAWGIGSAARDWMLLRSICTKLHAEHR